MNQEELDRIIASIIRSRIDTNQRIETLIDTEQILRLLNDIDEILSLDKIIIKVPSTVMVVGDIHGNINDLLRIFQEFGYPPKSKYLFLGDYVDRGENSFEVITLLFALKLRFPNNIYLLRGNHEIQHISQAYGFLDELKYKYSSMLFYAFHSVFMQLPLVALVGERIICLHGGISSKVKKISDLEKLEKPDEINEGTICADIVWSDPKQQKEEYSPNLRGCGFYFNHIALHKFLQANDLDLLIRSHEFCDGCAFPYDESSECITVFSNTDYCGKKNNASVINVNGFEVTKKDIKYLNKEERKKWVPIYPDWLSLSSISSSKEEVLYEMDEPNSEIDLFKHEKVSGLSHAEIQTLVE